MLLLLFPCFLFSKQNPQFFPNQNKTLMEASSKQWRRKSQTLMEASSPSSSSSSSKQMWMKNQSLYICFAGFPNGYAIHSISHFWRRCLHQERPPLIEVSQSRHGRNRRTPAPPLNEVSRCKLPHEMTPPPPSMSEVWCHYDEHEMGVVAQGCVRLDSKIYFVGSVYPKPRSVDDKSVVSYNLADKSVAFHPGMSFRKCDSIVFSANNRIFVLSKPIGLNSDEELYLRRESLVVPNPVPLFEVFNLSTQKWETLDPPPFFDPHSAYYRTSHQVRAHAVIGGYICISTTDASFKLKIDVDDVETMIWEPCMLFEDHPKPDPSGSSNLRRIRKYIDPACGSPFPFRGQAILFGAGNDILISMGVDELVAYKMVGDRVVNSQSFIVPGITSTTSISYIGNGLLCLVFFPCYHATSLYVKLLRLNQKEYYNYDYDVENKNYWTSQEGGSGCSLLHLKTVEINGYEAGRSECEFVIQFAQFLVRSARVLEKMVINSQKFPLVQSQKAPQSLDTAQAWNLFQVTQKLLSFP